MKTLPSLLIIASLLLSPLPGTGQRSPFRREGTPPPEELTRGRAATLDLLSGEVKGELLAVSGDSVWVLSNETRMALALQEVEGVDVQMHNWGAGRMLGWGLLAGVGSAVALTAACNSVEETEGCGGVFLGWTVAWGLIGGVAGAFIAASSKKGLKPSPEALRPYVRYPQGLPPHADDRSGPRKLGLGKGAP